MIFERVELAEPSEAGEGGLHLPRHVSSHVVCDAGRELLHIDREDANAFYQIVPLGSSIGMAGSD
jgi:hypothetical protein